jgi:hypothetical protein
MATLTPGWAFDDSVILDTHGRATRMLAFADLLRHPKEIGDDRRPLRHRWQRRIVEKIYGPSTVDGRRQVSTVFALIRAARARRHWRAFWRLVTPSGRNNGQAAR